MRNASRDVLDNVKGYDEYAKNYGELKDTINTLKTELSAGNKNTSQTFRKLVNTFKQVNTEGRQEILRKLQDKGITDILDTIAGRNASEWLPSDILRGGVLPTMSVTSGNILSLPAFSPKAMGLTTHYIGQTVKKGKDLVEKANNVKGSNVVKYIGGQVYDKTKATRSSILTERMKAGQKQGSANQQK